MHDYFNVNCFHCYAKIGIGRVCPDLKHVDVGEFNRYITNIEPRILILTANTTMSVWRTAFILGCSIESER